MSIASDEWDAEPEIAEDVAELDDRMAEDADMPSDEVADLDDAVALTDAADLDSEHVEEAELITEEVADLEAPEAGEDSAPAADASGFRRLADQSEDDQQPGTPELRRLEPNVPEQYDLNLPPELIPYRPHDPEQLPSPDIEPQRIPEAPKSPAQPPEGYRGGGPEGGF